MSLQIQPIQVWGKSGPNPLKVAILMQELNLPQETIAIAISDAQKSPALLAVNPNGRLPAIHDPNTDLTLWESGAIIEYLIERYDPTHQLSFAPGTPESYLAKQWLFFQTSGQGPYYGQVAWFKWLHPEQLPSAIERYSKEILRITGVLEAHLAQQKQAADGPWLVGNRLSYADLAFVPWQSMVPKLLGDEYNPDGFPHVTKWLENMTSREKVRAAMQSV